MRRFGRVVGAIRRFGRDRRGVSAVEFALVGGPFLLICAAIVETAVVGGASLMLDHAVDKLSRQVMIGQIQSSDIDATAFKQKLCDDVGVMFSCAKLKVDLRTYSLAKDIPTNVPMKLAQVDDAGFCFDPGSQNSITVLRAFYEWPWTASFLRKTAAGSNGNAVLFSVAAFVNEPFGASASKHSTC